MIQPCYPAEKELGLLYERILNSDVVSLKDVIALQDRYIRQCNDQLHTIRVWKAAQMESE